jgi:serine/threonine protein kinase
MYTSNNGLIGTAYYVSINTHLGEQQSRRDDLESIAYMLIRFLKGELPWQGFKCKSVEERNEKITQIKIHTSPEALCAGLPREFKIMTEVIRRLRFDDRPKYYWFRHIFSRLFVKKGFVYDGLFDWDDAAPIHRPLPSVFLANSAGKFQRNNERQMRARNEKVVLPGPRQIFLFRSGLRGV